MRKRQARDWQVCSQIPLSTIEGLHVERLLSPSKNRIYGLSMHWRIRFWRIRFWRFDLTKEDFRYSVPIVIPDIQLASRYLLRESNWFAFSDHRFVNRPSGKVDPELIWLFCHDTYIFGASYAIGSFTHFFPHCLKQTKLMKTTIYVTHPYQTFPTNAY